MDPEFTIDSGTRHLADDDFLAAFESCTLPADAFRHADHVRLAFIVLRKHRMEIAADRMTRIIARFATHHGAKKKYHDTITRLWMHLVATAIAADHPRTFDQLVAAHPRLLDKRLPFDFYSESLLMSEHARAEWVEPDLRPLPEGV